MKGFLSADFKGMLRAAASAVVQGAQDIKVCLLPRKSNGWDPDTFRYEIEIRKIALFAPVLN